MWWYSGGSLVVMVPSKKRLVVAGSQSLLTLFFAEIAENFVIEVFTYKIVLLSKVVENYV